MNLQYRANTLPGSFCLPTSYAERCHAEDLAELAAADHWRAHPEDSPTGVTVVHLHDVQGQDLGLFEVRCQPLRLFKASQLRQG